MSSVVAFIVVPFNLKKGREIPGEIRKASSAERAVRLAEIISPRFAGVMALEVYVDDETGEMNAPRELIAIGRVPEMDLQAAA